MSYPFYVKYLHRFLDLVQSYSDLVARQQELDIELAKLTPVINVTYNALSNAEKAKVASPIARVKWRNKDGLKGAVLMALNAKIGDWLTPPDVRNYLETVGFTFGTSSGRGLASIATTLKRMVPSEVETKTLESGQPGYRIRQYDAEVINQEIKALLRNSGSK